MNSGVAGATPKQYLPVHGATILAHSLAKLRRVNAIEKIVVVLHPEDRFFGRLEFVTDDHVLTALGGDERQDSVLNGLARLSEARDEDWVLVHDAVRPCVDPADIDNLINVLLDHPVGGLLGAPVDNTIKRVREDMTVESTVDRSDLWNALTPQMFRVAILREALERARERGEALSDEAGAVEALGKRPLIVPGDKRNIKVTHPGDLAIAEQILASQEPGN